MPTPELLDAEKEHCLVLVKPDGYKRGLTGEVLRRIEARGYVLKGLKVKYATKELLAAHYEEHVDRHFYPSLEAYMMSGPIVAVIVEGDRVVEGVRTMVGATNPTAAAAGTIRGDLGRAWPGDTVENVVHASDSPTSAVREIAIWFPELEYQDDFVEAAE